MLNHLTIPENIRIGTCSWKYDSWKGLVYDEGKKYAPHDYLADYAQHYNTVEIDQWFWSLFPGAVRLPNPKDVQLYTQSVPHDFRFSVKAPNAVSLTHYYSKQPKGSEQFANQPNPHFLDLGVLEDFLQLLDPMKDKLGPIMFQFEYLNQKKMPSLPVFLEHLAQFFAKAPWGYQYAVEIRNPSYLKAEFFSFLKQHQIAAVLLDGYYMPPISKVIAENDIHTSDHLVIRLHGPDRQGIEKKTKKICDKIVVPQDTSLKVAAQIVQHSATKGLDTYVNVNNHYEGCAPLSIQRLVALL